MSKSLAVVMGLALAAMPALAGSPHKDKELGRLTEWLTGSFSSEAQSVSDKDFFDIRLEMAPIWRSRTDGPWLYVEQAAAAKRDAPYRQRVYHLERRPDGALLSLVFTLPDPQRFVGAWSDPERLNAIEPADLVAREGCAIVLRRRADGVFEGATDGSSCPSDLRGATYATSQVTLTRDLLRSWDRGFDADGKQVWGATKGPYEFRRLAAQPAAK